MKALYELLYLLPPGFEPDFAPRHNKLCLFLLKHEGLNKEEATLEYYGDIGRKKYFGNLKNELKKALTRYLIAYPSTSENNHRVIYEECYQNFATYKIFLARSKRKVAIEIAEELLPRLCDAELYQLVHIVSQDLYFHYSSMDYSRALAKKYKELAALYFEVAKIESKVRMYHSRVGYICNSRKSYSPEIIAEIGEAVKKTLPFLRLGYHSINRLVYAIAISRYKITYDYENIIKYCDEALANFPNDHPNSRSIRFAFNHKKIPALVALKRLEEAKEVAKAATQLLPEGTMNWKIALLKRVTVCFHAGDYQEAYDLFKAYKERGKKKSRSKKTKERQKSESKTMTESWKIIEGYIHFLIHRGKIEPYEQERFYLGKFLNEVPIYSKDKAGHNINILIVQILIRMQRNKYGYIIDHIDSLREYARRYTRNPESKRANIFINMILKMNKAQYHRSHTELKTQKLLEKLNATPIKMGQNLGIEIIPYPILWKEILLTLEDKFRAVTVRKTSKLRKPGKK